MDQALSCVSQNLPPKFVSASKLNLLQGYSLCFKRNKGTCDQTQHFWNDDQSVSKQKELRDLDFKTKSPQHTLQIALQNALGVVCYQT